MPGHQVKSGYAPDLDYLIYRNLLLEAREVPNNLLVTNGTQGEQFGLYNYISVISGYY